MKKAETYVASSVTKLRFSEWPAEACSSDTCSDRAILQHWIRAPTTPQRVAQRSRIVLLWLDGARIQEIASTLAVSRMTVELWTARYSESGPRALLHDAPGRGRRPRMTPALMRERLRQANLLGADNLPVSLRRAAALLGVSATSVWRALKKPFLSEPRRNRKPPSDAT